MVLSSWQIEISLLIDKPGARYFVATILAVALILRGLVQESRMKKEAAIAPGGLPMQIAPTNAGPPQEDPEARAIFEKARALSPERPPLFCYAVSESASQTIVDIAATLGAPGRHAMTNLLRGNLVREVSDILPEEIDLLVYA